jgi:hypothetical protein
MLTTLGCAASSRIMLAEEHAIEALRRRLRDCNCYPAGVVPVAEHIGGTAAFPAGAGLYRVGYDDPLPPFPVGGVMFVAHNVDAEEAFEERLARREPHGGSIRTMSYWRGMYALLDAACLDRSECFFTNAYVGLKRGGRPEGLLGLGRGDEFRQWCAGFLEEQVRIMRPRLVAVVGRPAWTFVARMAAELETWRQRAVPAAPVRTSLCGHSTVAVPLLHPSGQGRFMHVRGYRSVGQALNEEAHLLSLAAAA